MTSAEFEAARTACLPWLSELYNALYCTPDNTLPENMAGYLEVVARAHTGLNFALAGVGE